MTDWQFAARHASGRVTCTASIRLPWSSDQRAWLTTRGTILCTWRRPAITRSSQSDKRATEAPTAAPNGDLITANGDAVNVGGTQNALVESRGTAFSSHSISSIPAHP